MKTLSDRATQLASERARRQRPELVWVDYKVEPVDVLAALDEWQANVEERLASIGLGLVPGVFGETVLASGCAPRPEREEP